MAFEPRLSPDGRRVAMAIFNGPTSDIWVYDVDKTTKTRLTSGLVAREPVWTHDGQFIVYQAPGGIFWTRADGAGKPQLLVTSKTYLRPGSFSPEGQRLVLFELLPGGGGAIKTVPVENASGQLRARAGGEVTRFEQVAGPLAKSSEEHLHTGPEFDTLIDGSTSVRSFWAVRNG